MPQLDATMCIADVEFVLRGIAPAIVREGQGTQPTARPFPLPLHKSPTQGKRTAEL